MIGKYFIVRTKLNNGITYRTDHDKDKSMDEIINEAIIHVGERDNIEAIEIKKS